MTSQELTAFALRVNGTAASLSSSERFGEDKVYISSVYEQGRKFAEQMTLGEFKAALVTAQAAGLICLTRADLPWAADLSKVEKSTTYRMHAEYHYVQLSAAVRA